MSIVIYPWTTTSANLVLILPDGGMVVLVKLRRQAADKLVTIVEQWTLIEVLDIDFGVVGCAEMQEVRDGLPIPSQ